MGNILINPIEFFSDLDGNPLQDGALYLGEPSTNPVTNPITVYQDPACTIALQQPVSISMGVPMLNGTPIAIYMTAQVCSLLLNDSRGRLVMSLPSMSNPLAITQSLISDIPFTVNSISGLRALSKIIYGHASVLGYYAPGDGGGGQYYYDPTDTTSADNGGTVIVATDGGRWKWQPIGPLTPEHFGAMPNTSGTDSYAFLNAGLAAASALNVRWHWTTGRYYVSQAAFVIPSLMAMTADAGSQILPFGSAATTITSYVFGVPNDNDGLGPQTYPSISGFTNAYAFQVQGNVKRILCAKVDNCFGIVTFPVGANGNILDSIVTVNQGAALQVGMNINCGGGVMEGSGLSMNFLTTTHQPVLVNGSTAGSYDTNFLECYALDMAATPVAGDAVLANMSGMAMPTFRLTVTDWFGGTAFTTAPYAQIATGVWNYAHISVHAAGLSSNSDLSLCLAPGVLVTTRSVDTQLAGTQKFICSNTQGVANFTNGHPAFVTDMQYFCQVPAGTVIPPGGTVTFYAYSIWNDTSQALWRPSLLTLNQNFSFVFFQDSSTPYEQHIQLVNNSGSTFTASATTTLALFGVSHV